MRFLVFLFGLLLAEQVRGNKSVYHLSLEELLETEFTSLTRTERSYFKTPASVIVFTSSDLKTYPGETLTDLLRNVIGAQAFETSKHEQIFSIRGSASPFSNKLQVLINGQSITSFPFSGVFWSDYDLPLSWIERVEILKGQHGAVWGSNNVNGVVNIILKNNVSGIGKNTNHWSLGVFNKRPRTDILMTKSWETSHLTLMGNIGFDKESDKTFYSELDAFDSSSHARFGSTFSTSGEASKLTAHLLRLSSSKDRVLHLYPPAFGIYHRGEGDFRGTLFGISAEKSFGDYKFILSGDHSSTETEYSFVSVDDMTNDFDFRIVTEGTFARYTVGASIKHTYEENKNSKVFGFKPDERSFIVKRVYGQVEKDLLNKTGVGVLSLSLEENSFTGTNLSYNLRFGYSFTDDTFGWVSAGKAYRLPSRIERDMIYAFSLIQLPNLPQIPAVAYGNNRVLDENAVGLESGLRHFFTEYHFLDLSLFHYWYDNLITMSPVGSLYFEEFYSAPVLPFNLENNGNGKAYGAEITNRIQPSDVFDLDLGYAFIKASSELSEQEKDDSFVVEPELRTPEHSFLVRGTYSFRENFSFVSLLRYWSPWDHGRSKPLWTLDAGFVATLSETSEIKLIGRNLIKSEPFETVSFQAGSVETDVPREIGVYYTKYF